MFVYEIPVTFLRAKFFNSSDAENISLLLWMTSFRVGMFVATRLVLFEVNSDNVSLPQFSVTTYKELNYRTTPITFN